MSPRDRSFTCQSCGAVFGRWQGKCEACGEWNTVAEESVTRSHPLGGRKARKGRAIALEALAARPMIHPGSLRAWPSSTGSAAAASCEAPSCSWVAILE